MTLFHYCYCLVHNILIFLILIYFIVVVIVFVVIVIVFIVCNMSFIVCVVLCAVFCLSVLCYSV
jgi:hypothetical protein